MLPASSRISLMTALRFAALALVLLLVSVPVAACFAASAQMSAAEGACCRHMAGQCGAADMPASHSCCQPSARQDQPWVKSERPAPPVLAVIDQAPLAAVFASATADPALLAPQHAPPESPPAFPDTLRI